jgi:acyl-CoA hydrolase
VSLDLARWLRPGDGVAWTQACGEPVPLVDALLDQADAIGDLRAFIGPTWRDLAPPASLRMVSYGYIGRTGRIPGLEVIPCHHSRLPALFADGTLPGDVVMIQVAPPDAAGRCSFGVGCDYIADAARHARTVIAEVNERMPRTAGDSIAYDDIDVHVHTSRPLLEAPAARGADTDAAIAAHVAALVKDGDTIQIGVGGLPDAILSALHDHRELGVHSGMISDGVLDMIQAGAVQGTAVVGAALGSQRLFDALEQIDVAFRPVSYTHAPATLAQVGRLCAINSVIEVDLLGQANGEFAGDRGIGAVGGQVDFLRAAATGIVALPAKRIVRALRVPVSASRSDVDWVVTEHGARSLRGLSDAARRRAVLELAGGRLPDTEG